MDDKGDEILLVEISDMLEQLLVPHSVHPVQKDRGILTRCFWQ